MVAWPHRKCFARLLFLSVLLLPAAAAAQFDTAQVSGVIQDGSGGILPGVDVVLVSVGTGIERRAVTNESGLYTFPNVPDFGTITSRTGSRTMQIGLQYAF